MEYRLGLEPCPMCIVQRIAIALVGLIALIAMVHHKGLDWYFGAITLVTLGLSLIHISEPTRPY